MRRDEVVERDHAEALREVVDRTAAAYLNALVPVRVLVVAHVMDTCPHIDEGRMGWLRKPIGVGDPDTGFHVPDWGYVSELSPPDPGGDNCPARWIQPRNLLPVRTLSPIAGYWSPDR